MYYFANRVGRLLEARFAPPLSIEDIDGFSDARREPSERLGASRISCVDVSHASVVPPEYVDRINDVLRSTAVAPLRHALLLPTGNATFALQMGRLMRESGPKNEGGVITRRAFHDRRELEAWLGEVMTDAERARLKAFLDGA